MFVCSKLDAYFLTSFKEQPPCHLLPLSPDLHTEVSRLQKNPYSARVHTNATSTYSMVVGMCKQGYLSPCAASLKSAWPTKSCRVTSAYGDQGICSSRSGFWLGISPGGGFRTLLSHRSAAPCHKADTPVHRPFYCCNGCHRTSPVARVQL